MAKISALIALVVFISIAFCIVRCDSKHENKYSAKANEKFVESYDPDFRNLHRPFRMAKLNLVWTKAQHVGATNWFLSPDYKNCFHSSV